MKQDTKIVLALIGVTALGYYLWNKSQPPAAKVAATDLPPITKDPMPSVPSMPIETLVYQTAPISNFANMTNDPKAGGFFTSEKVKLNY